MTIKFKEDYVIDVTYDFSPMRKDTFDVETMKWFSSAEYLKKI